MKFIPSHQTNRVQVDKTLLATSFDTGDAAVQLAITEITGRYPEQGRLVNSRCKELIYVLDGNGLIEVEGEQIELKAGDVIHTDAGERMFWNGELKMVAVCAPRWTSEQHLFVD